MGRQCSICNHGKKATIEEGLRLSRPTGVLSREFGVSQSAINRHRAHIVPIAGITNDDASDIGEISKLRALVEPLLKDKDPKIRLAAIGRLESLTTLEARIGQEASAQQTLTANPAWELIRTHLLNIINECDRCRKAVLEAMPPGDTRGE